MFGKQSITKRAFSDPEEDLETEMLDSRHMLSVEDAAAAHAANYIDETSYHTLEVDDTELAEYPTHLVSIS